MRLSAGSNPIRRSPIIQTTKENTKVTGAGLNRKNLVLQSVSSATARSIPVEETLEEALIDLYLSVKIRSNEEVSYKKYSKFETD